MAGAGDFACGSPLFFGLLILTFLSSLALTAALILPDGRLTVLRGGFTTDTASLAALGHAVHAAGAEFAIRAGNAPLKLVTLRGAATDLTLISVPQGILVLEHEGDLSAAQVLRLADEALPAPAVAAVSADPAPASASAFHTAPQGFFKEAAVRLTLADALHATEP